MRRSTYEQLLVTARRHSRRADEADDLVQEALLEAVRTGRTDFEAALTLRWLGGIIRNKARLAARTAVRRRQRETLAVETPPPATGDGPDVAAILTGLPPSLKAVAALALTGHTRREIAYLLRLDDVTLRQRISTLSKRMRAAGLALPEGLPGLGLNLAYGRIRDALLPALLRQGGVFASHDPDGHLFVIRRAP